MKRKLLTVALLTLAIYSPAQNNPIFYGGYGDGWGRGIHIQASITTMYQGGNGDGWNKSSYTQGSVPQNFYGGNGDGWEHGSYIQGSVPHNFYGGNGDGFHSLAYVQNRPDATSFGGNGDGFSSDNYSQSSTEYAYKGGIGDGWASTYTPVTPLPVRFVNFDAFKERGTSHLQWRLASDEEVSSFDVERSNNAVSFEKIGNVAQNNAANKKYNFIDEHPMTGNNYYRLKVIYHDGKMEYTGTKVVNFEEVHSLHLNIYPNPATDIVNVELPNDFSDAQYGVVNIYGISGTMVYQQKVIGKFPSVITVQTASLTAGNYVVHIAADNNKTAQGKIVVVKQ